MRPLRARHRVATAFLALVVVTTVTIGAAAASSVAAPRATTPADPSTYVHGVCTALSAWVGATGATLAHVRSIGDDFHSGKLSSAQARRQTLAATAAAKRASDLLVKRVRAAGEPTSADGAAVAGDERDIVADVAHVYQFIGRDLQQGLGKVKDKDLYRLLEYVETDGSSQLDFAGMPLQPVLDDATLGPIARADAACTKVIDAYRVDYEPSGVVAGDCIRLDTSSVVPCSAVHDAEVIANLTYPAGTDVGFPGVSPINTFADEQCAAAFAEYVGVPETQSTYSYVVIAPSRDLWDAGDREIICVAGFGEEGSTTGSIRGTAR